MRSKKLTAFRRILSLSLTLFGGLVLAVTIAPPRWYIEWLAGPWTDPKGSVLIVLGGDSTGEQMLGQHSYWRSVYAVLAWRQGGFQYVVLSGDSKTTFPMRDFIVSQGVPASVVLVEDHSLSTRENALFVAPLLRPLSGPYVLMTSDFHMWRAQRVFQRLGIPTLPRPIPDAQKQVSRWSARWGVLIDLLEESAKIVVYKIRGWA